MFDIKYTPEEAAEFARQKAKELALVTAVAAQIKRTYGPPPLVYGEDPKDFDRVLFGLIRLRLPDDSLAELHLWNIATETWFGMRLDRLMARTLDRKKRQNLDVEKQRLQQQTQEKQAKQAADKARAEVQGNPDQTSVEKRKDELQKVIEETPQAVDILLNRAEREQAAALAFHQEMPFLTSLDDMKSRSFFRRNISIEMSRSYRPRYRPPLSIIQHREATQIEREGEEAWLSYMLKEEKNAAAAAATGEPAKHPDPPPTVPGEGPVKS